MDALLQDVRYAFRHLHRSPGFAGAAILTLAFGIGANTAVFTMLNTLVLQRLPIKDPDGLISITSRDARGRERYLPFVAVHELAREGPLVDPCGYNGGAIIPVEANGVPTQALTAFVSGRCFRTFGVAPIAGRAITDEDAPLVTAGNRVVLISHQFWMRAYGGDPTALGQLIRADGVDATIVGVLPRGFGGLHVDAGIDIFAPPDSLIPARADRRPVASQIVGHLRQGVTLAQAQAEMSARWPALLKASVPPTSDPLEGADLWGPTLRLEAIGTGISAYRVRYAPALILILGLTALLLALACVNLGSLLLTRSTARGTELAVRLALGGSRWRIAQQMLVESLILSLIGAALAVPLSMVLIAPLAAAIPPGLVTPTISFGPDRRVLAVTGLVGVSVGILITALPMWIAMHRPQSVRFTWHRTIAGATSRWARGLLVAQVALSVVMLAGAGLLVRSVYLLQRTDLGVRTAGVINVRLMPLPNVRRDAEAGTYYRTLVDRLTALPGVQSVGLSQGFPRIMLEPATTVTFTGETPGDVRALSNTVSPEFFDTVGIPLLAGRFPSWTDTSATRKVVVVSDSLARMLAADGDVLDRRVNFGTNRDTRDLVVVGIVGNATAGNPRLSAIPTIYFPTLQRRPASPNVLIRTTGQAAGIAPSVRQILQQEGRDYAQEIIELDELFARAPSTERMSAMLAGAVGGLAVLLVVLGVHGALAYAVSRRTREIGVRIAIGATPRAVARMVFGEACLVTLTGLLIGLPLALATARALRGLMFGVSEADPVTFAGTALLLVGLGLGAAVLPARRAACVDPVVALKAD